VVRFIGGVVMNLNAFDKPKQPAANR
ncbi:MAG: hypothetical protein QOF09_2655, partial [Alphaproteobacteria bacterium]|nr:hypothetical protein [Alphaproteobacteria bacterium]